VAEVSDMAEKTTIDVTEPEVETPVKHSKTTHKPALKKKP
jgi:hypothetical protein